MTVPILVYADMRFCPWTADELLSMCTPARRKRILCRPERERTVSAMAEPLLHHALHLAGYGQMPSVVWEGKPYFSDPAVPFTFNLTHAGQTAALLLTPKDIPCGLDCEEYRPLINRDALANRLFSDSERAWIAEQADVTAAFFHIWTAKEAFIKYTGEGFSRPLRSVSVNMHTKRTSASDGSTECRIYHLRTAHALLCAAYDVPLPPHACAFPFHAPIPECETIF